MSEGESALDGIIRLAVSIAVLWAVCVVLGIVMLALWFPYAWAILELGQRVLEPRCRTPWLQFGRTVVEGVLAFGAPILALLYFLFPELVAYAVLAMVAFAGYLAIMTQLDIANERRHRKAKARRTPGPEALHPRRYPD